MNNNIGPLEGQNLNPTGTTNQGVETLSQPTLGGTVPPIAPAAPLPQVAPIPQAPVAPVPPIAPTISEPTVAPTVEPLTPTPPQSPTIEPVVNIAPLPPMNSTPQTPVESLGAIPSASTPVAPLPGVETLNPNPTPVVPTSEPLNPNPTPLGGTPEVGQPIPPTSDNAIPVPPITDDKPKANKNMIFAIVGIVLVLTVAVGGIVAMKFLGNKDNNNDDNNPVTENTTTKVNFNGYTFEIPETIDYTINGNLLMLTSKDNKWATGVGVLAGAYNSLKENKATIQTNFQAKGYSSSSGDIKTYEGVEYLTYEISQSGANVLAAYTRLSSNVVLYLSAASTSNQFDYGILEAITPIVSTVKENSSSLGMELPDDDVSDILDNITEENNQE